MEIGFFFILNRDGTLEGAIIATQTTANDRYYGHSAGARAILAGSIAPPSGAKSLVGLLNRY